MLYKRKGKTITAPDGSKQTFPSINKAKAASRKIQLSGKGLGRGDLEVLR